MSENTMKIAVPLADGKLSSHFGHCEQVSFIDVDLDTKEIVSTLVEIPPEHTTGSLPKFVGAHGANLLLVGSIGAMAKKFLAEDEVEVIDGCPVDTPETLVKALMDETLTSGSNECQSGHGH